jgi:hypothetical protein
MLLRKAHLLNIALFVSSAHYSFCLGVFPFKECLSYEWLFPPLGVIDHLVLLKARLGEYILQSGFGN